MIIIVSIVLLLTAIALLYLRQPKFGKAPSGKRLERIMQSPHYKDGKFQNLTFTPDLAEGYSYAGILYDQLFGKHPRRSPVGEIPSVKTDLLHLPADSNLLVWFGHSSYYMQIDGRKFLVDPVFSGNASPLPGTARAFAGSNTYSVADLPDIDYLFISHDHYDHLDYETVTALKNKVKKVICGLGVGAHLEYWGYAPEQLIEKDWNERVTLEKGFDVNTIPARHFSGRTFRRNNTLWLSFLLETPSLRIFIGGDSGFDGHFSETGDKFGPVDLAILENGQYNLAWHAIHSLPEEVLKAAAGLRAKRLMPVHSSKFMLAMHPWDEPLKEVTRLSKNYHIPLVTPKIGEVVDLNDTTRVFEEWWQGVN